MIIVGKVVDLDNSSVFRQGVREGKGASFVQFDGLMGRLRKRYVAQLQDGSVVEADSEEGPWTPVVMKLESEADWS